MDPMSNGEGAATLEGVASDVANLTSLVEERTLTREEVEQLVAEQLRSGGVRTGYVPPDSESGAASAAERWDARRIIEGEAYQRLRESGEFASSGRMGNVRLGRVASREAMAAEIGSADVGGLIPSDRRGLVAPPIYRPLTLLDLIPSGATDSNLIEYVQVTSLPAQAAETAEGAIKPEASLALADADAPVRTIAAWIKVRKQTLADAAALQSLIDTSLRYDVRRRLEAQVVGGNGTGENIRGILNTTGVANPAVGAGEAIADRLHHGIVAVQLANMEPTAVALHPNDFEKVRLSRENTGGAGTGGYLFGPPSAAGAPTIWGLATVVTPAIPEGTGLVMDPRGALVVVREAVTVLLSDSDQDDFVRNRVTVLAEGRYGLVVPRPDAFAKVTLT